MALTRTIRALSGTPQDTQWAVRTVRRRPVFAASVVLMLGVGIGLNAAIFTVVDAALFTGFRHVQRNERLVRVSTTMDAIFYPDFEAWRTQSRAFVDLALVRGVFHTLQAGPDGPQTVFTTEVTPNAFRLLGVAPVVGRDFVSEDAQPGAAPVVMLQHDTWTRLFQAAADVVGRQIRLDGAPATIIGVMPEGFSFPAEQEIWTPLIPTSAALARETTYARYAYGRLGDGASLEAARADLQIIGGRLAADFPATNKRVVPTVAGFDEWFVGAQSRAIYLGVWGAAFCVFLIVCGNIANLFVLQTIGRGNELRVRQSLGASSARLVRQVSLEAGLLTLPAGAVAWWVMGLGVDLIRGSQVIPPMLAVQPDTVSFGLMWVSGALVACGVAAAAAGQCLGRDSVGSPATSDRTTTASRRGTRMVDGFVGLQVALAIVLLVSAGVLVRMLVRITTASAGVEVSKVVTASIYLPPERYVSGDVRLDFFRALDERLSAHRSIATVGFGEVPPTARAPRRSVEIADSVTAGPEPAEATASVVVSPGYFRTIGAAIVEGRDVLWTDTSATAVVLVNQRFAARHWPNGSPLGRRLRFAPTASGGAPGEWLTVVGVTSDIVQDDATRQRFGPVVYVPYSSQAQSNMFAFVRSRHDLGPSAAALRESVFALDPSLPLPSLVPLKDRLTRAHALERLAAQTLGGFSTLAVALAAVGLYTVLGQVVTRRTREIGIRLAVGATGRDIMTAIVGGQMKPFAAGVGVGLALSAGATGFLSTRIVGLASWDPVVLMAAIGALGATSALGCWFPMLRALRTDPAVVLRQE
ncbi:MAG TPA: ABC transporter permease [Vicinamibacterales bacterium]|nr:ABC transporter permease [Vicinamibacterales bacterium]